jgi:hypothetical protein
MARGSCETVRGYSNEPENIEMQTKEKEEIVGTEEGILVGLLEQLEAHPFPALEFPTSA